MSGFRGSAAVSATTAPVASDKGQLNQSLVRLTRFYASLSPTMMALLLAKKTRYGRYIPLPDALPDGVKVGKWVFRSAQGTNGAHLAQEANQAKATPAARGTAYGSQHLAGAAHQNGAARPAQAQTAARESLSENHLGTPVCDGDAGGFRIDSNGTGRATASPTATKTIRVVEYEVVHDVPGRVRLRIPRLAHDTRFAQRLAHGVMALTEVHETRINPSSRSLVVRYRHQLPGARSQATMVALIVACVREAAMVDAVKNLAPEGELDMRRADQVDIARRMALPAISLGIGLGMLAGLSLPAWLAGGVVLVAARPIFGRALEGIRTEKRLTVEFLDATTIALMVSQASFLPPAIIVSVIEGSEALREITARRSRHASLDLMLSLEQKTVVERAGSQARRSWDEIQANDHLLLYPGDQIPVDGLVVEGRAVVDQRCVTGDALPVVRSAGDTVQAATYVVGGYLRVLAQQTGYDTRVGQTLATIQDVPKTDTRVSNYARRVGNWAVMPTLVLGGAVFAGSGSVARATGIVNLDLGTGMRVSAPIAILSAQTQAARRGILIRSGRALEMLAAADTVLFDKTATLTSGRVAVVHVQPHNGVFQARDVLALAASAEQAMNHPIGKAIVHHARQLRIPLQPCTTWDYVPGVGVMAEIDGHLVHVGSRQLMTEVGIDVTHFSANGHSEPLVTATQVYVSRNHQLLGGIYCADTLRPESAGVIEQLGALGLDVQLVSGDDGAVAQGVASSLGMAPGQVHANHSPSQKAEVVLALRGASHTVAMVGDGINDVAAMTQADVSIALGSASDLARATADVVLVNDDLRDVLVAMAIARHTMNVLEQNKILVVAPNLAGIAYGALMVMNPISAMLINNASAAVAALNSLRPLRHAETPASREP